MATGSPLFLLVSIAYWSTAESIRRRSLIMRLACERLRARRNPGTAIAASRAMIATTIMISTRVKPPRRLLNLFNMLFAFYLSLVCLTAIHDTDRGCEACLKQCWCHQVAFFQFLELCRGPEEPRDR